MSGYTADLADGQPIYIPLWSAKDQFGNLTQACKYLGQEEVINISTLNVPAAMLAVMGSDDAEAATQLVFHFVRQARVSAEKIDMEKIETLGMALIIEIFTHVMHAQYADFFESGLAKAPSPSS